MPSGSKSQCRLSVALTRTNVATLVRHSRVRSRLTAGGSDEQIICLWELNARLHPEPPPTMREPVR